MVQHTERKIAEVHQRLDTFELRVLSRPAPQVDVRLPTEDTVMAALFATSEIPPPPPRENTKRHKCREEDEARQRKKQRRDMEAARRALLADEEARRIKVVESAAGASRSRDVEIAGDTADSVFADAETTEGFHTTMVVGTMGE